jgi:hypothetical protein
MACYIEKKRREVNSMRTFLLSELLCCAVASLWAGQIRAEQAARIGEWTIGYGSFDPEPVPTWSGQASRGNSPGIRITICSGKKDLRPYSESPLTCDVAIGTREVEEARLEVFYVTPGGQQMPRRADDPIRLEHRLVCRCSDQAFVFEQTSVHDAASSSEQSRHYRVQNLITQAISEARSDPLITFAREFFRSPVELGTQAVATGYPTLEASVDGGAFLVLKPAYARKRAYYAWDLPAGPGQSVVLRARFSGTRMSVTTRGIRTESGPGALAGEFVSLSNCKALLDDTGTALLEYGTIRSAHLLTLKYQGWQDSHTTFAGSLFLRWGRPEEAWLRDNSFPLAPKLDNSSTEACIQAILKDLDVAFDLDHDYWMP